MQMVCWPAIYVISDTHRAIALLRDESLEAFSIALLLRRVSEKAFAAQYAIFVPQRTPLGSGPRQCYCVFQQQLSAQRGPTSGAVNTLFVNRPC